MWAGAGWEKPVFHFHSCSQVLNILQESSLEEAAELIEVLTKFEFEGLILAHDKIAERDMVAPLQGDEDILDRASQYTDDSIKIVRIDKTNEPLVNIDPVGYIVAWNFSSDVIVVVFCFFSGSNRTKWRRCCDYWKDC